MFHPDAVGAVYAGLQLVQSVWSAGGDLGLQGVKKVCVEAAALGSLIFIGWYFSLMDGDVMKFATIVFFLGIAFYGLFVAKDGSTELPEQ